MTAPAELVRAARAAGVAITLERGRPILEGRPAAVAHWAAMLRDRRAEVLAVLRAERSGWSIPRGTPRPPLFDVYMDHALHCPHCRAAGRNPALNRCTVGLGLWRAYQDAPTTSYQRPTEGARP